MNLDRRAATVNKVCERKEGLQPGCADPADSWLLTSTCSDPRARPSQPDVTRPSIHSAPASVDQRTTYSRSGLPSP